MMKYIKDGSIYPYYPNPANLRKDFPNVSFGSSVPDSTLAEYEIFPVTEVAPPTYDAATQNLEEGQPFESRPGEWNQTWVVTDKTPEELAEIAEQARRRKNKESVENDPDALLYFGSSPEEIDAVIDAANSVPDLKDIVRQVAKIALVQAQGSRLLD